MDVPSVSGTLRLTCLWAVLIGAVCSAQVDPAALRSAFAPTDRPGEAFERRTVALDAVKTVDDAEVARELIAAWQRVDAELRAVERERGRPARNLMPSITEMEQRGSLDAGLRLTGRIEDLLAHAEGEACTAVIDALFDTHLPTALRAALAPSASRLHTSLAQVTRVLAAAKRTDDLWIALRALRALGRRTPDCHADLVRALSDPVTVVRAEAMHAIVAVEDRSAVPRMLDRLSVEKGRTLDALGAALELLTGERLGTAEPSWRAWWSADGEAFLAGAPRKVAPRRTTARSATQGGFFGIPQDGRSILFVVDASDSMGNRMGRNDGRTRWDACVAELDKAIEALGADRSFSILVFAQRVRIWRNRPVRADAANVAAARNWIADLDLELGTATFEAFEVATQVAGPSIEDRYFEAAIDTICFLSDGRPTVRRADQPRSLDPDDPLLTRRLVARRDPLGAIRVDTVSLGRSGAAFMRKLAAEHGGRCVVR